MIRMITLICEKMRSSELFSICFLFKNISVELRTTKKEGWLHFTTDT